MTETTTLRGVLLPELEKELEKTRTVFAAMPDGPLGFKPHEKSFTLARLAGHVAELPYFITAILTTPNIVFGGGTEWKTLHYESRPQLLAEFNHLADRTVTAMKSTSDETLAQDWKLSYKEQVLFSGTRYMAYRDMGLNHLIHHRGQLMSYLRQLDVKVPGVYGPSADEQFGG